jgi:hypothetical protein
VTPAFLIHALQNYKEIWREQIGRCAPKGPIRNCLEWTVSTGANLAIECIESAARRRALNET